MYTFLSHRIIFFFCQYLPKKVHNLQLAKLWLKDFELVLLESIPSGCANSITFGAGGVLICRRSVNKAAVWSGGGVPGLRPAGQINRRP